MISIDISIIWAILIFLILVYALNRLLFQPILRVQAERESRTSGLMEQSRKQVEHYLEMFGRYQSAIKNGRIEGYRRQEEYRSEAMKRRSDALARARRRAEELVGQSREAVQKQVQTAKNDLEKDAEDIARSIASSVLQRPA
jgi:F-type H+-transporting ATPase subunit b